MSEAEKAYKAAQRLIAKAKREGAIVLILFTPESRALTQLPPEIAALTSLQALDLSQTQITDISPLSALTGLNRLYLSQNQITDLSPITAFSSLTMLYVDDTNITDFSPLASLTGLNGLSLEGTQIADLSPLAALTELTALHLSNTQITDLSPLAALTSLIGLWLRNASITDLSPLAALTSLTALTLDDSAAFDLRPLRHLTELAENPNGSGLTFSNTPATRADPRIAEIAEIEDNATRARELFAYLETWVPPGEIPTPPKPDPIFETILINGQLELAADPPTQAERDEALKRALHRRLQNLVPDLARAAGNHFPKLASKARVLAALVEQPFDQLDLLPVHLEVETLHNRLTLGSEDGVPFPDDVLGPLSDVTRSGPGLTLGHPSVDLHLLRTREARENPSPAEDDATHIALSKQIIAAPDANGPVSVTMETRVLALEDNAMRQAAQKPKHQWMLWTLALTGTLADATSLAQAFGPAVTAFVKAHAPLLMDVAATYGAPFALWFGSIMGPIFLALGVKEEVIKRRK